MRKMSRIAIVALILLALLLAFPAPVSATSLTLTTNSAADNMRVGFDSASNWSATTAYLSVGYSTNNYYRMTNAMRFNAVNIPRGSQVTGAYLVFTAYPATTSTWAVSSVIRGLAVDTSAPLVDYGSIRDQIKTNASVVWSAIPAWSSEVVYSSPDISAVLNEIVNRPGWNAGNSLTVVWGDEADQTSHVTSSYRIAYSYAASPSKAPQMRIEYQAGAGGYQPYPAPVPANPYVPTYTDPAPGTSQLTMLTAQMTALQGTVTQLQQQVLALPATVGAADAATGKAVAGMTPQVTQALQLITTVNQQTTGLSAAITGLNTAHTKLQADLTAARGDLTTTKADVVALKTANADLSGKVQTLLFGLGLVLVVVVGGFVYLAKKLGL